MTKTRAYNHKCIRKKHNILRMGLANKIASFLHVNEIN